MPITRAARRILNTDPTLAGLIAAAGPYRPQQEHTLQSPFEALARSIAHQQLNGIAAGRILERFVALFAPAPFPDPQQVIAADEAQLRAVGFSFAKIKSLKDLAAKTIEGIVPRGDELTRLTDAEIIERLTAVRGIGRWTVEMLLLFQMQRPDVLPVDDFGVRNGFRLAYGLKGMPTPKALAQFGARWKPYRSIAAWYLWRAGELSRLGSLPRCRRPPRIAVSALPSKVAPVRKRAASKLKRKRARRKSS